MRKTNYGFSCLYMKEAKAQEGALDRRELNLRSFNFTAPQDEYHSWGCLPTSLRLESFPFKSVDMCLYVNFSDIDVPMSR